MNRFEAMTRRAVELIRLDASGHVTNVTEVVKVIEAEFNTTTRTAYNRVVLEGATRARRLRGNTTKKEEKCFSHSKKDETAN